MPKFTLVVLTQTEGDVRIPDPVRETVCGLPEASSVIEIRPGRTPGAVGVNVT